MASRCDLSCDHCYVYADPDRTWLRRPKTMGQATVRAAACRIAEHAKRHSLRHVSVVLHGGEPLLLGPAGLQTVLRDLRSIIDPIVTLELHLQSNGVRLTPAVCEVLADHHVKIGISLDGDESANDRHRRFADGRGSHRHVVRALKLLRTPPYRAVYGGLLCTIDITNDPIAVYGALLQEDPPRIDLLLPHATWDRPPSRPDKAPTAYADWLLAIYDRWTADGRTVPIRTFDSLLSLERGGRSGTEALGRLTAPVAVVETDGEWEQVDSLKTVSADTPSTGLDVALHSVDEVAARALGRDGKELSQACQDCPVVDTCGGGLFAHRFGRGNGFDNPSVYCTDLFALISGVRERLKAKRSECAESVPGFRPLEPLPGLPVAVLRELACGSPTRATLAHLVDLEYALNRALLARMASRMSHPADCAAWELLSELDRCHPVAVRAVLSHPYLRVRVRRGLARGPASPDTLAGLLASIAAAVVVRAGVTASVAVPLHHGALCLPGVGTMLLHGARSADVVTTAMGWTVRPDGGGPAIPVSAALPGWHPVRHVLEGIQVGLDDADPDRDCFPRPVLPAGSASDSGGRVLVQAWTAVRADAPALADQLDALVRIVTPARPRPHAEAVAASTRTAFGAVALGPADPDEAGTLLVREAARIALGAVRDVCGLEDPDASCTALDPLFARAAVVELAHARQRVTSVATEIDGLRADVAAALACTTGWTPSGRLLLEGLRTRIEGW